MKTYIFRRFLAVLAWAGGLASTTPARAVEKKTVCTITINSADEKKVFMSRLNPNEFNFVELTEMVSASGSKGDWFENACSSGVKCDVLVVSGHFGGQFFGSSGLSLGLDKLESMSCNNKCAGVLQQPKEVYLFGCNTLAKKEKDARTPEQYLRVLIEEGIERTEAERIVAARYGPFGSSFKDRMERIFEGVPIIYGFNSVGPLGSRVKSSLSTYLTKVGDYKTYLTSTERLRADNWMEVMRNFNRDTGRGLQKSNPSYAIKTNSCKLDDGSVRVSERLLLAIDLLSRSPMLFLPIVSSFANKHLRNFQRFIADLDEGEVKVVNGLLNALRSRQDLKNLFEKAIGSEGVTPTIKIDLIEAERNFSWIDEREFGARLSAIFSEFVKKPTTENSDLLCSTFAQNQNYRKYIKTEDFAAYDFSTLAQYKIAHCVGLKDPATIQMAIKRFSAFEKKNLVVVHGEAFSYLLDLPVENHEQEMLDLLKPYLNYRGKMAANVRQHALIRSLRFKHGNEQISVLSEIINNSKRLSNEWTDITENLSLNRIYNPSAVIFILEASLREAGNNHGFLATYPGMIGRSVVVQDWLAANFERVSENILLSLGRDFAFVGKMESQQLKEKLIRVLQLSLPDLATPQIGDSKKEEWYLSLADALRAAALDLNDLKRIKAIYETSVESEVRATLRDLLFVQGRGRMALDASITQGIKAYVKYSFGDRAYNFSTTRGGYVDQIPAYTGVEED